MFFLLHVGRSLALEAKPAVNTTCPSGRTPSCATQSTRRATSSSWSRAERSSTAASRSTTPGRRRTGRGSPARATREPPRLSWIMVKPCSHLTVFRTKGRIVQFSECSTLRSFLKPGTHFATFKLC